MQNFIRKIYLSVMVSVLCMITLVTATFAWIGFLDFSDFEEFEINLMGSELEEYGIEISLTGEEGTFGSSVDAIELKRIILKNTGRSSYIVDSMTDEEVKKSFSKLNLDQCTVIPNADKSFPEFKDIDGNNTKMYFKFDIYISPFKLYESDDESEYYLNAYLLGDLFQGTKKTKNLVNKFTYPSDFVNEVENGIKKDTEIKNNVTVDSSSACRISIQKYDVVDKYDTDAYKNDSYINDLIIFQGGTKNPTYDSKNNVYSFGGILEEKYNLALCDYNKKFKNAKKSIPTELYSRGDIEYNNNYQIIDSSKTEEKIGINQMMKMTICFWFEGWDADCFDVIDRNPVTINLNFSNN